MDVAGICSITVTLIVNICELNVEFEAVFGILHLLFSRLPMMPFGNVTVIKSPLTSAEEIVNWKDADPSGPTAVEITNPESDNPRQPMQGLLSRLTNKGVWLPKVFTVEKSCML